LDKNLIWMFGHELLLLVWLLLLCLSLMIMLLVLLLPTQQNHA